ncbi:acid resistance repetitive basic protein Asr [Dickeya chrysanthemi]|uniref:acid resistance repetitive basic protein Asr n=2 Tax=Dickeya chrysanthemi TaxID=556 RepID=UPI0003A65EF5
MNKFLVMIAGAALGLSSVAFAAETTSAPVAAQASANTSVAQNAQAAKKVVKKKTPAAQKAQAAKKHKKATKKKPTAQKAQATKKVAKKKTG